MSGRFGRSSGRGRYGSGEPRLAMVGERESPWAGRDSCGQPAGWRREIRSFAFLPIITPVCSGRWIRRTGSSSVGGRLRQLRSRWMRRRRAFVPAAWCILWQTGSTEARTPGYQWQLNGVDVGSDSSGFTHAGWRNGDVVACVMTSADHCVASPVVVSNPVIIQVDSVAAVVSVGASRTTVCSGDTVVFTAEATNGGAAPAFEWLEDGHAVPGGTGDVWRSSNSLCRWRRGAMYHDR